MFVLPNFSFKYTNGALFKFPYKILLKLNCHVNYTIE